MASGLDDVVAVETELSDVDGARGRLVVRGTSLDELAGRVRFEALVERLFAGFFPDLPPYAALAARLGRARVRMFETLAVDPPLIALGVFDAMRALVARLPDGDDLDLALSLLAAPAVFAPALMRLQGGLDPIAPDAALPHAQDVLRMAGALCDAARADALDTYLVTVADHGLNASTFAARVVASTQAGLTSAVLAGLGALKGPLHGGAPGPVIEMLDAIGAPTRAEAWLDEALARGDRLMGFGHRIYRVRDPRADALKAAIGRLATAAGAPDGGAVPGRLALAEAVERAALSLLKRRKPDRPLDVNVEFYTALLLEALGFPVAGFTCVFAMGRTAGWIAHAREQQVKGRLIRPQSLYVGPEPRAAA